MPTQPHRVRQAAESFGTDADRYDRARPPYPEALIERIAAASPEGDILDVGCGTGIAARQFQAVGCTVLGVEPDERMATFARRTGLRVETATFEGWDPAGRTFDAVVAGTAWHWVDPEVGAARAASALRPGGRLAPFWHVFQLPAPVVDAFAEAYRRVVPDSPFDVRAMRQNAIDNYQALLDTAAAGMRATGAFGEPERWRDDWERTYTRDEWLDQMPTTGALAPLPPEARDQVLAAVAAAIDARGGSFTLPCATLTVTAVRTGTPWG